MSYFKSYSLTEFMHVFYELPDKEVDFFADYCKANGKSEKEVMGIVNRLLNVLTDEFYKTHEETFKGNTQCAVDDWFMQSVYHWRDNNHGIVPPAHSKYWPDQIRYFFTEDENSEFIDIDVKLITTDIDFSKSPSSFIRYIKFLLINSNKLRKDVRSLSKYLAEKYPDARIKMLSKDPNEECTSRVRGLLFTERNGFSRAVDLLRFEGWSNDTIVEALKAVLGDAKIEE